MRQPGIEPGSIAWKATMLTFTPPTLNINVGNTFLYYAILGYQDGRVVKALDLSSNGRLSAWVRTPLLVLLESAQNGHTIWLAIFRNVVNHLMVVP